MNKKIKIAVLGAGVAGLSCSRILRNKGLNVELFDKGRFVGGRLASRDRDENQFDYGAQYFTIKNERFRRFLQVHISNKNISRWDARFSEVVNGELVEKNDNQVRYVANPHMRSLGEFILGNQDCHLRHTIASVVRNTSGWHLNGTKETDYGKEKFSYSNFDYLVMNMPPRQIRNLIDFSWLESIDLSACIAGMYSFEEPVDILTDAIFMNDSVISWAARDSKKPMRPEGERWVIHAAPQWSKINFQKDDRYLLDFLLKSFSTLTGVSPSKTIFDKCHRWKFAKPEPALSTGCHYDPEQKLGFCGDWCNGARVEGAFVSGELLAEKIFQEIEAKGK